MVIAVINSALMIRQSAIAVLCFTRRLDDSAKTDAKSTVEGGAAAPAEKRVDANYGGRLVSADFVNSGPRTVARLTCCINMATLAVPEFRTVESAIKRAFAESKSAGTRDR